jgi:hypothetical protein
MTVLDRLLSRLRIRLASERGFAVPTVMLMTVAAMAVASVGVVVSIQGQSGVVRDQGTKSALQVAESGVNQAMLYYNRGVSPCAAKEGEWCGPVTGMSVNGGAVQYWTKLGSGDECQVGNEVECVEIVSQGTVNGVTRRVDVSASTLPTEDSPGPGPFASAGVLSLENMTLDSNAVIHTGVATNGEMTLNSNAKQCGQASVGIGRKMKLGSNAHYYSNSQCTASYSTYLQQALTLPLVNQGDAATNNDNARFFTQDLVSGKKPAACWNGTTATGMKTSSCGARELVVGDNSAVTLGGSVYSFCKLQMKSNTALYVQAGSAVTIYFDSPEACGYSSGVTQLDIDSNARVTAESGNPVTVAMLFVGSDNLETRIQLDSNTTAGSCDQNFVIYAPRSNIDFDSNTHFCGAVAGKSVHLDSNAEIWSAKGSESFSLPGLELPPTAPHYTPYRFVECSAVEASPPDAGC